MLLQNRILYLRLKISKTCVDMMMKVVQNSSAIYLDEFDLKNFKNKKFSKNKNIGFLKSKI
jgi:hypothetical protein